MRGVCFDAFRVHEAQHARLHPETQTRGGMLGISEGCFRSRNRRVGTGIAQRRSDEQLIAPRRWEGHHVGLTASLLIERATGWRPFEYRNYVTIGGANGIS